MTLIILCFITSYVTRTQIDKSTLGAKYPAVLLLYGRNRVSDVLQCQTEARTESENKRLSLVVLRWMCNFLLSPIRRSRGERRFIHAIMSVGHFHVDNIRAMLILA